MSALASHNTHTSPEQTHCIAVDLSIIVGVFIKFTVETLNAQLSERFTYHQRIYHNQTTKNFWN